MNRCWLIAGWICAGGWMFAAPAHGQIMWTDPGYVNADGAVDGNLVFDSHPQLATSPGGKVLFVWERVDYSEANPESRIYVARSTDGGRKASQPAPLFHSPLPGHDRNPHVATNGKGKWLVVWESTRALLNSGPDSDIFFMKSLDNGATWLGPFLVNNGLNDNLEEDTTPVIATTGQDTWVAAWKLSRNGVSSDIAAARYQDGNGFWEAPVIRNAMLFDSEPQLANDGANTWIVAAQATNGDGSLNEVFAFASEDDAESWTPFQRVSPDSSDSAEVYRSPRVTTDKRGTWLIVWMRELPDASDMDPFFAYSVDNGINWNGPVPIGGAPDAKAGVSVTPLVATDGMGNWLTVWESTEPWGGSDDEDMDILYSVSSSGGAQWSSPSTVNQNAINDNDFDDEGTALVADAFGNWYCVWSFSYTGSSNEQDSDILGTVGFFTGWLQGRVIDAATQEPIASAAVWARKPGGGAARLEVTDQNGFYRFDRLPAGSYTVSAMNASVLDNESRPVVTAAGVQVHAGAVTKQHFELGREILDRAVHGTVYGEMVPGSELDRVPLVGVKVSAFVNGATEPAAVTFTSATGEYVLNGLGAKGAGTSDVVIQYEAPGYEPEEEAASVAPGANAVAEPTLSQKAIAFAATLAGVVTNAEGSAPVGGASVVFQGPVNVSRTTQANGAYVFESLPSGTYTVTTSKAGFMTVADTISVTAKGAVVSHNVHLAATTPSVQSMDVNNDGLVNAADVQLVVNALLGQNLGGFDADVNGDNEVNVVDVQLVVNMALGV